MIIFGEAADLVQNAVGDIEPGERPFSIDLCEGLEEAVKKASTRVEPGDVVLLSPGGTSFDEFIDYEERGRRFTKWVKELT